MIKCLEMVNTDSDQNSYRVKLFADTKEEVVDGADIIGLPANATLEMGSSVVTANADVAFRKSDGTWNWIGA